jgi:hypothetical protein
LIEKGVYRKNRQIHSKGISITLYDMQENKLL